MKEFIEMLTKFNTTFVKINENEIAIPVITISATDKQGTLLPQSYYQDRPLITDEAMVHLTFTNNGIDWAIIIEDNFGEEE